MKLGDQQVLNMMNAAESKNPLTKEILKVQLKYDALEPILEVAREEIPGEDATRKIMNKIGKLRFTPRLMLEVLLLGTALGKDIAENKPIPSYLDGLEAVMKKHKIFQDTKRKALKLQTRKWKLRKQISDSYPSA